DVRPLRFVIAQPEGATLTGRIGARLSTTPQFAISPDGRYVVLVAMSQRVPSLWLRSLDTLEIRKISGTEQASYPFWSPDSRFIAFFSEQRLLKIPIDGGPPIVVCPTGGIGLGGTWNREDVIVFAPGYPPNAGPLQTRPVEATLVRVSAAGGVPTPVTKLDAGRNDLVHAWPSFLPDGRHFVYLAQTGSPRIGMEGRRGELRFGSLDSTESTTIGTADSAPAYASGHLFFCRDGTEFAQRFDPAQPELKG